MSGGHLARARLLVQQDRNELALESLTHALAEDPGSAEAMCLMAVALSELERHDEALKVVARAIAVAPDESYPHYVRARVLEANDRTDAALESAREALRIDPNDADHHALEAGLLLASERYRSALASAERALRVDPEHEWALNLRSLTLNVLGRRDEARAGLDTALGIDPENAATHANLGWSALHESDARAAIGHFEEALRIDPENQWARDGLIEALRARNFLYRAILGFSLLTQRFGGKGQLAILLVAVFGLRAARKALEAIGGGAEVAAIVLGLAWFALMYFSWIGDALLDVLIWLDPRLRHVLGRDQRRAALWFVSCVPFGLVGGLVVGATAGWWLGLAALGIGLALAIPVTSAAKSEPGWPAVVRWSVAGSIAACALVAIVLLAVGSESARNAGLTALVVAFFGVVASTWLLAILSAVKD